MIEKNKVNDVRVEADEQAVELADGELDQASGGDKPVYCNRCKDCGELFYLYDTQCHYCGSTNFECIAPRGPKG